MYSQKNSPSSIALVLEREIKYYLYMFFKDQVDCSVTGRHTNKNNIFYNLTGKQIISTVLAKS